MDEVRLILNDLAPPAVLPWLVRVDRLRPKTTQVERQLLVVFDRDQIDSFLSYQIEQYVIVKPKLAQIVARRKVFS